ncbi:MAG: ribonuclease H family protein [Alloprevotella sp.]|nr:ribonuclease H family protein [Prevotella sp.]MBR1712767.1 ribonuclease H family protein [Alloprevotella sp.]
MSKAKEKYYVVWQGREPGIYTSWETCKRQVNGQEGARYKSFPTREEAACAFVEGAPEMPARKGGGVRKTSNSSAGGLQNPPDWRTDTVLPLPPGVVAEAIAVDAACSGNPGRMEYRGVDLRTGMVLFHFGPVFGTNNIGEFLAIVHALALLDKEGRQDALYSDSRNAMLWVRQRRCKTKLVENAKTAEVFSMIRRAEKWLREHTYTNPLLKWETGKWGEIPADFGRK